MTVTDNDRSFQHLPDESRKRLRAAPHPEWFGPMRATLTDNHFTDPDWIIERKLDGECALIFRDGERVRLLTQNRKALNQIDPELNEAMQGQELVIGGCTQPRGERTGFDALLFGYFDAGALRYAGRVGTGFEDEFLRCFRKTLNKLAQKTSPFADEVGATGKTVVRPEFVTENRFNEWTRAGKLRHPRFLGLRDDKPARDVTRQASDAP